MRSVPKKRFCFLYFWIYKKLSSVSQTVGTIAGLRGFVVSFIMDVAIKCYFCAVVFQLTGMLIYNHIFVMKGFHNLLSKPSRRQPLLSPKNLPNLELWGGGTQVVCDRRKVGNH